MFFSICKTKKGGENLSTKYDELEKLKELKDSGAISQEEFEIEKNKIFNRKSVNEKKPCKKVKLFFLLTIIFLIITVVFWGLEVYWSNVLYDVDFGENGNYGYFLATLDYEDGLISRTEYKEIEKEYLKTENIYHFFKYGKFVVLGFSVIFLATGSILKIKEKGGIEIVN